MSTDFMKSNPQLDEAINSAETFEDMRERMKAELAAQGIIERPREDANYGARVIGQPQSDAPTPSTVNGFKYEKEIRWHESLKKRPVIIRANTMEDLIALEHQLTD